MDKSLFDCGSCWQHLELCISGLCSGPSCLLHSMILPVTSKASLLVSILAKGGFSLSLKSFNTSLSFIGNAGMPGRNAFANLNLCFYHSSAPVIYSTLLTYRSGQAQHKSLYLPAIHHCTSMFCAAASIAWEMLILQLFYGGF